MPFPLPRMPHGALRSDGMACESTDDAEGLVGPMSNISRLCCRDPADVMFEPAEDRHYPGDYPNYYPANHPGNESY